MKKADSTSRRGPLMRSQSLPLRLHDGSAPSQLVEALDVISPKRSSSLNLLAPRPTHVAPPSPPAPGTPLTDKTVSVRRFGGLKGLQVLFEEQSKDRWLMLSPKEKDPVRWLAKTGPVGRGAHGRVHVARYEPVDGPALLFALKEAAVALEGRAPPMNTLLPRAAASVDSEARMHQASGSKVSLVKVLELDEMSQSMNLVKRRRLWATPLCDGNVWHLRDWIFSLPSYEERELFVLDLVIPVLRDLARWSEVEDEEGPLVHCDVKPENIFYHKGAREAYLVDFSCAAFGEEELDGYAGTGGYIAPEFLFANLRTRKADMWSLGVTILDLLCTSFLAPRGPTMQNLTSPRRAATAERTSLDDFLQFCEAEQAKAERRRRLEAGLPSKSTRINTAKREDMELKYPLERYCQWLAAFKKWQNNPFGAAEFHSEFEDIDEAVDYMQVRYPVLHPMMMRLLEWDPNDRPDARTLLAELSKKPRTAAQKQTLARLWSEAPVEPSIQRMTELFKEPTLPALKRTTSVDNFVPITHDDLDSDSE